MGLGVGAAGLALTPTLTLANRERRAGRQREEWGSSGSTGWAHWALEGSWEEGLMWMQLQPLSAAVRKAAE